MNVKNRTRFDHPDREVKPLSTFCVAIEKLLDADLVRPMQMKAKTKKSARCTEGNKRREQEVYLKMPC